MYASPSGAGYPPPADKPLWQKLLDWTGTNPPIGQTPQQLFDHTVAGKVVSGTKQVYQSGEKVVQAVNNPASMWVGLGIIGIILVIILRK